MTRPITHAANVHMVARALVDGTRLSKSLRDQFADILFAAAEYVRNDIDSQELFANKEADDET